LFAAVSTQAATVNVSDEEFGRRLSPKVMRLATNVLWEELTDFFQELGQTEVAEAIQGILKLNETIRTRSLEKMGEIHLAITANVTAEMDLETAKILDHLKPMTRELPIGT
jgi:glutamyl-tRNA reductase